MTATAVAAPVAPPAAVRRRVRLGPRPRPALRAAAVVGLILGLALLWIGARAILGVRALQHSRQAIDQARTALAAGDTSSAVAALERATADARTAADRTGDPVWHLFGHLPLVGVDLRTAHTLAASAGEVTAGTTPLLRQLAGGLDHGSEASLRRTDGSVNLVAVQALAAPLSRSLAALSQARADLSATGTGGIGPIRSARSQLLAQVDGLAGTATAAQRVVSLAPVMLGRDGTRRYLIALQNPAEARGTGGYLGAAAVISATDGRLHLDAVATDDQLISSATPAVTVSPDFTARWRPFGADSFWGNANLTPDFGDASTVWEALYAKATGQRLDGVLALDPGATGALVLATGGVTLPDGTRLAGGDVAAYLESGEYLRYPTDPATRRAQIRALVSTAFGSVTGGEVYPVTLLTALARSAGAGEVLLSSSHPEEEAALRAGGVAGQLDETPGPYVNAVIDNAGANKMDYYLQRSLTYRTVGCATATRPSVVTLTLQNSGPAAGLPLYVSGYDAKDPAGHFAVGTDRSLVSVYTTIGATLGSADLDGAPVTLAPGVEHRHPVFTTYVNVPAGQTRTLTLHLTEPSGGPVVVPRPQALANPETVTLQTETCPADAPLAAVTP